MNMITSLFSRFDPCSSSPFFTNWFRTFIVLLIIPFHYWLNPNRHLTLLKITIRTLHSEFKILLGSNNSQGSTLIFLRVLIFIAFNNFLGLFPYVFTRTRHLVTALSVAIPLWISFILFGWVNNIKFIFAHLVPIRTPSVLMPFMVIIETISNIIRPLTLAVRLSANIIAGHLLLTLLGNQTSSSKSFMLIIILILQVSLLLLEWGVSIIQAYVFAVLSTLYSSEVIDNH
jgi:F-type H+-transporting ATPase subunit a